MILTQRPKKGFAKGQKTQQEIVDGYIKKCKLLIQEGLIQFKRHTGEEIKFREEI